MSAPARRPAMPLLWLAFLGLVNALVWLSIVPPWQAPDEPKHFEYLRLLAEGDRLIAFETEAEAADLDLQRWIVGSMDRHRFWWYGHAPGYDPARSDPRFRDLWVGGSHTAFYRASPAYYALAAALQPADRLWGLYAARLLGAFGLALTVLFTGWAARELFPKDPMVRYGAPAFVALQPMQAFLAIGVNSDMLANLAAAFACLLIARLLARGWSPARLLLLLAAVLAALLVKRTTFYLLPLLLAAGLASLATRSRRPARALGAGLTALAAGAWLVWRWLRGGGWAALPEAWRFGISRYVFNEPDQAGRILAYLQADGAAAVLREQARGMLDGFWGSFGWQMIHFPAPVYSLLAGISALAALGLLRRLLAGQAAPTERAGILTFGLGVLLAAGGALAFFAAYLGQPYGLPPQGRYLFVAMLPAALCLTAGLSSWIPAARRPAATLAFVASLCLYDLAALLDLVLPYFYR